MDKVKLCKMMSIIEEEAKQKWQAMFKTIQYKWCKDILNKEPEDITYVDRETLRNNLHALCLCVGLNYYNVITRACQ